MRYRFGNYILDSRTGTVSGPDGQVSLRRQTFRLLEVLLEHAPELLDRDTLLDEAWGRTALSPNVLPQAVSELRQALGDNAQSPRYIETVHRRGYRIICSVECADDDESPIQRPDHATVATTRTDNPSVASNASSLPWLALLLSVTVLIAVSSLWWKESSERRWLHSQAIPEIRTLMDEDLTTAWRHAHQVRQRVRADGMLEQLWLDLTLPTTLTSEPEGALVEVKGYRELDEDWIVLGHTPLEDVRLPIAMLRFRVSSPGYQTLEAAPSILPMPKPFILYPDDGVPDGMVYVQPGPVMYMGQRRNVPGFWIDRLEVTNREYRRFVDAGGYRRPEFWQHAAAVDGRELPWDELMAHLVDATGLPGPSTWAMGTYPEGQADHPVEGVSWFEAAAYAEFVGKQLPTTFHWYRAAGLGTPQLQQFSDILLHSNFNSNGTVPAGSLAGLGHNGTLDMAGNVAEWCLNADGDGGQRHILGGSWMETQYRFQDPEAWPPLERRPGFGIRLVLNDEPPDERLLADIAFPDREFDAPVDDATFDIYARQFDYDDLALEAVIDEVDDSHPDWRREWVSFAAAYPNERVIAQVFLPRNAEPPYQTVVYYPAGYAMLLDSSRQAGLQHIEFFIRSGRAVVYPVLLGTFERKLPPVDGPMSVRHQIIHQVKDIRRTVDYIDSRDDLDGKRLLLYGISYGGFRAPYALAVEPRFATAIVAAAGMSARPLPAEIQLQNYLPRIGIPFLLINGRHDFNFPPDSSQEPFFELLGTPDENKRHLTLDHGHIPPHLTDVIRASLKWTDRWLGTVETNGR